MEVVMKKKTVCFFIVLMLVGITCLSAQMSRSQLQEMYVSHLKSEGYSPSVDSDGDVNFTAQGQKFYINVMDNDPQSFHVVLTNFLDVGSSSSAKLKAYEAASYSTRTTRVARAYMTSSGKIAVDAFIFITKPEDFKVVLNRMISVILTTKNDCVEKMK
jgi:hypothetical protein